MLFDSKWAASGGGTVSTAVVQHYNANNEPTSANGSAYDDMVNAQKSWNGVEAGFLFSMGDPTTRCGSLIQECRGPQVFDQYRDIGWMDLGRCTWISCTLAVTWWGDQNGDGFLDDSDVAFNTRISPWVSGCEGDISIQAVALHEFGHVAGLDHTIVEEASMFPSYSSAICDLHEDDKNGLVALYPVGGGGTPTLQSITVTPASERIQVGESLQFTATANYDNGTTVDVTGLSTWSSSDTATVTINSPGLAYGDAAGSVTVTAAYLSYSDTATLTVEPAGGARRCTHGYQLYTK